MNVRTGIAGTAVAVMAAMTTLAPSAVAAPGGAYAAGIARGVALKSQPTFQMVDVNRTNHPLRIGTQEIRPTGLANSVYTFQTASLSPGAQPVWHGTEQVGTIQVIAQ